MPASDEPTDELCGDKHYRDDDPQPLQCNRPVNPQPDGRRHRGEHRYRSEHFGWSWPNRKPLLVFGLHNPRRTTPPGVIDGRGEM